MALDSPRKPYYFLFGGILFIIMSFSGSEGKMIPSEVKMITGILAIAYGGYLLYKKRQHGS